MSDRSPKDRERRRDSGKERSKDKEKSKKSSKRSRSRSRSPKRSRSGSRSKKQRSTRRSISRSRSKSPSRSRRHSSRSSRRSRDRSGSRAKKSSRRSKSKEKVDPEKEAMQKKEREERERNRDEYTVFVSQVHPKVDERDLFDFFSHVGRVEDIRLIRDQRTHKSKGLCYVEFWERDSVMKAVALTGQLLGGFPITVAIVQSNKGGSDLPMKLFVGSLHPNVVENDLRPVFEAFGPLDFVDLHKDPVTNASKGFGFVQFQKESDARTALSALNGLEIAGRAIKVTMVDNKGDTPISDLDDDDRGGLALTAQSRAQLMHKLQRGTNMVAPTMPGAGLWGAAPAPSSSGVIAAATVPVPMIQPTTCVVVKNMFDPKTESDPEFHLDIRDDVEEEAHKFGTLKHIFVDKDSQGMVYMRFAQVEGAQNAIKALHGRWFASRQITAEHLVETTYLAKFPEAK